MSKVYAFASSSCWTNFVSFLQDKLASMGFENWEAESALQPNLIPDTGEIQNRNEFSFITNKLDALYFTKTEVKILELRESQSRDVIMKLNKDTPGELFEKIQTKLPESDRKVFKNIVDFISKVSISSPA